MLRSKVCTGCGVDLPVRYFHKRKTGLGGVNSRCKECVAEYRATRYREVPEVRERRKREVMDWQKRNPEKVLEIRKRYYQRTKGK